MRAPSPTQGYVHLDAALVVAADRVAAEIANMLDGKTTANAKDTDYRAKPEAQVAA
jgi:hypothetical protein